MEPDLNVLKQQFEDDLCAGNDNEEVVKVKLFRCVGDNTHDAKQQIEDEINQFLSTMDSWFIEYVNVNVVKNFLPMTTMGEYQEVWYGVVQYREET